RGRATERDDAAARAGARCGREASGRGRLGEAEREALLEAERRVDAGQVAAEPVGGVAERRIEVGVSRAAVRPVAGEDALQVEVGEEGLDFGPIALERRHPRLTGRSSAAAAVEVAGD